MIYCCNSINIYKNDRQGKCACLVNNASGKNVIALVFHQRWIDKNLRFDDDNKCKNNTWLITYYYKSYT